MLGWLKQTLLDEKPPAPKKTWEQVISAYRALLEKHPTEIMDVSMLPVQKKQMKTLLKVLCKRGATAELERTIAGLFELLSLFQEGVGAMPIDARAANLEKWLAWEKVARAEADTLRAEWKSFLASDPIG